MVSWQTAHRSAYVIELGNPDPEGEGNQEKAMGQNVGHLQRIIQKIGAALMCKWDRCVETP